MTRLAHKSLVTIHGKHLRETEKAVEFSVTAIGGNTLSISRIEWFPFSQIEKVFRTAPDSSEQDYLVVSEWILGVKGLLDVAVVPPSTEGKKDSKNPMKFSSHFDSYDDDIPF